MDPREYPLHPRECPRILADVRGSSRMSGDLRECTLWKLIVWASTKHRDTDSAPDTRIAGGGYPVAAASVISSARSMTVNASRSCSSVMQSGGFVKRLFQLMNV